MNVRRHFQKVGIFQTEPRPCPLCYRNPDGGIVVVATNWANDEKRVSFSIDGKTYAANLKPHSFNTVTVK